MSTPSCYPLTFAPMLYDKVWGGDRLARFGKPVKPGAKIGESWELSDMLTTSASGAGGGSARSVIAAGPLAGKHLREARAIWGPGLLGRSDAKLKPDADFPLLVKYLDARENLSVQVHPSPVYAASHKDAHLKTECWYILDADPGAMIYKGLKPGVTRERFAASIADGSCVDTLIAVPAIAGECHNLPSGTVHALGAGVLVAEVQTPSDTTFRVFDWGRTGRQLHIDQSLSCADYQPAPLGTRMGAGQLAGRHVSTEFFTLDEHRPAPGGALVLGDSAHALVLMPVRGSCTIRPRGGSFAPVHAPAGSTVLIPAAISSTSEVVAEGEVTLLVATVL